MSLDNSTNPSSFFCLRRLVAPMHFYSFAVRAAKWCAGLAFLFFIAGGYLGLVVAPPDYQMGDSYRIMFVHAPAAWMSMFIYAAMAVAAAAGLVWHIKLCEVAVRACAPLGAAFTICALVTGSLWGKPTWGTFWVWDARLTSELVLLFLYLGVMALAAAYEDRRVANRAAAVLAIVGVINLPIIHYSVQWWNTLHQGASLMKFARPSMPTEMLVPLLLMLVAFKLYFGAALLNRMRCELLSSEIGSQWVAAVVEQNKK